MTTANNRKVSPSLRKYERAIRNVSPPSGRDEDRKQKGFFDQPRLWLGGKSGWDWMQLLIIPLVLTVGGLWFSNYQHDTDQQRATDQQQAAILQTYIDNTQDLLLNHNLLKSKPYNDVAILARARTMTALRGLDPKRKGLLVKFIYDTGLIGFMSANDYVEPNYPPIFTICGNCPIVKETEHDAIIFLAGADLSGADLYQANLFGADLHEANLTNADLRNAYLASAILIQADLSGADLHDAWLFGADLSGADFSGANLSGADLSDVDLVDAKNLTQQQLDQVSSCKDANLLPLLRLRCHHNQ